MNDPGLCAEQWVARRLRAKKVAILAQRYRTRTGEIDLIAQHQSQIIMIEVRFRACPERAGYSVDWHKRQKLISCAQCWLSRHPRYADDLIRFDTALVWPGPTGLRCQWITNAFELDD